MKPACVMLFAMAAWLPLSAAAQSSPVVAKPRVGLVLEGGADWGGDEVARVYFDDDSSQSVDAGRGLSAAIGFYVQPLPEWSVRATVGYKYESTRASDADIYLERVPVDVIATWHFAEGFRVGGGATWHTGIKFHGDDIAPDFGFDDAFGYTLEAGWRWIVVRYTGIDYKDDLGYKYKADSFGLHLVWEF